MLRARIRTVTDVAKFVLRKGIDLPGRAARRVREQRFPGRVRHVSGPSAVAAGPEEMMVVCLVRDGARYLDAFLAHYRALGARHVVLLDNGSTDGTLERAAAEPEVTVLQTDAPYRTHKVIAKRYLVRRFGQASWVLCVDIDELFDYPYRERLPLPRFLGYLNAHGYTAVVAHLLDLFPRGSLVGESGAGQEEHRYYDLRALERSPYQEAFGRRNEVADGRIAAYYGGVRLDRFGVRAMLTKHPLQLPSRGVRYVNSHIVRGARIADVSAVLLHYKYVGDFVGYAERIVRERSFFRRSAEYRQYLRVLAQDSGYSLFSEGARELRSIEQLHEEGFLAASDAFLAHLAGPAGCASSSHGGERGEPA